MADGRRVGVLGLDLTQMRRKAQTDTVNLQWWEGRGRRSGEKHTAGLWELLVGQGKRGLCQNEGWHVDKAVRKAVANLKLMSACMEMLTQCD